MAQVTSTPACGTLKCQRVIHTVGPMWLSDSYSQQYSELLHQTFFNVLNYANNDLKITSISIPAIGTGTNYNLQLLVLELY